MPLRRKSEALNTMGVYAGQEDFIYGEPRNSSPMIWWRNNIYSIGRCLTVIRHTMNLWGPRAYAETSKMKVLEFLPRSVGLTPLPSYSGMRKL